MKERKLKIKEWVKKHKTELAIAGITTIGAIVVVIGIKNKKSIKAFCFSLQEYLRSKTCNIPEDIADTFEKSSLDLQPVVKQDTHKAPHARSAHIRNLSSGRNASIEKVLTAAENGFNLKEGQTWVRAYTTGDKAA